MPERLSISEIHNLFTELESDLCQKNEFMQLKRAWSSSTGRKLANSSNAVKRDRFKKISQHIRIMDQGFEENMDVIYEQFCSIAKKVLAGNSSIETKCRQKLEGTANRELRLSPALSRNFTDRYKDSLF